MVASAQGVRRIEPLWGTVIGVYVCDPVGPRVLDDVFDWFRRVDDLFSTWRPETEISRIGRGELDENRASAEVQEVLAACEQPVSYTHLTLPTNREV